jgi:hypothetical protein
VAGQVLLKGVVPRDDIDEMAERCDVWAGLPDSELPPPLKSYDPDWENDPKTPRSVNNVEYASPAFARLALNPEIMRVVLALTGNAPQAHGMSLVRDDGQDGADIPLHGGWAGGNLSGANGLRNPANDYQASGGRILATFVNCATTLVNVPDGAGFVCVPGSHRSAFAMPEEIDIYTPPPSVVNICPNAGDTVVFTEMLCHGSRRWTEQNYPRRTIFQRYTTSYASWSPGVGPIEEYKDLIPAELYELKLASGFQQQKKVVTRLLADQEELAAAVPPRPKAAL